MSNNVKPLIIATGKVTHRVCPDRNCAHVVTQTEVNLSRFNYDCPKCGRHKISEFQPIINWGK